MIMMGQYCMDDIPFRQVYIHALVRDSQGRKMSTSLGNVVDPMDMIKKFGTDSLRFTLASLAAMGRDIKLSEERIEGYRHFVNKLWNAARFSLMNLPPAEQGAVPEVPWEKITGLHHKWIIHRLEEIKRETDAALAAFRFNDAAQGLYKFVWNELCDWYLELVKPDMQAGGERQVAAQYVLSTVLQETLILLHPMAPFVTAEIWSALPGKVGRDIATEAFPAAHSAWEDRAAAEDMEAIMAVIGTVRTIRAELNIAPSHRLNVLVRPVSPEQARLLEANREVITTLARLADLTIDAAAVAPKASASGVAAGAEVIVPLHGAVNLADEVARLDKELAKLEKEYNMLSGKLANPAYVDKAPAELVERDRARVAELGEAKQKLTALQSRFKEAMSEG